MTARTISIYDEDGNRTERTLPMVWAICGCCEGEGKSSLYLGAITQSDREPGGSWEDPDEFAEYMRGGYDRTCDECGGSGKVVAEACRDCERACVDAAGTIQPAAVRQ